MDQTDATVLQGTLVTTAKHVYCYIASNSVFSVKCCSLQQCAAVIQGVRMEVFVVDQTIVTVSQDILVTAVK